MRPGTSIVLGVGLILILALSLLCRAEDSRGLNGIALKSFAELSGPGPSPMGRTALGIDAPSWRHAESVNFIYHCQSGPTATVVAMEAEFYYRVITADLRQEATPWQAKSHIFIFEDAAQWRAFQSAGQLDPWTGGLNTGNELFLLRDGAGRWKGRTLGHEVAHLVMGRFFPGNVPLWLNEGYAENVARRAYAAFLRARGYAAKPARDQMAQAQWVTLEQLMARTSYPRDPGEAHAFYIQSDRLVTFLLQAGREEFPRFLAALARGSSHAGALGEAYGEKFSGMQDLEDKFRIFAAKSITHPLPP